MKTVKELYTDSGRAKQISIEVETDTDVYKLIASEYFNKPYNEVTEEQRSKVKKEAYIWAYGGRTTARNKV